MYFNNELSDLKDRLRSRLQDSNYSDVARDRINFILWELKLLHCFLHLKSLPFASECSMLDVSQKMIEILKSRILNICPDSGIQYWKRNLSMKSLYLEEVRVTLDSFGYRKEVIWKTKQEFRAEYSFPNTSLAANKVDDVSHKFVMEVIDVFVENLNVLVKINDPYSWLFVPVHKKQIEQVLKELKLLRFFVCFVSNKCIEPQYRYTTFYTHALIEASHIAMVVWLHLPVVHNNGNQDLAPTEVSRLRSDFMEKKIKSIQPDISRNNIYIDVLQALKSTIPQAQKKHAAESGIVEIPTHSLMVGLSDQMANLQEMLCLLKDNLIHLPILDLEFHLQDMDSVIIDAGLLIYSFYDMKGEKEDTTLEDINRKLGFGLRIAKMCGQLPLSIVLVAGILSEMEKEVECWEQVANNLGSHIHNDSRAILDKKDRVIAISRLIRLWISESFIKSCEGRSLEDIAEGYLENLIGRNLVMVTQRADSDGKVKACRLHDVLLDFCKERAAEENFLLWIKRDQITKAAYSRKQHTHLALTEMDNLLEWSTSGSLVGSGTSAKTLLLPSTVWDMVKLRYLYIPNFSPENKKALLENSPKLDDLETLSNPYFARVEDAELMLRKTPNFRKLICEVECLEYPHQYHVLNFPIRLEILKLYRSKASKTIPFCISAPNLKYLKLSGFYLDSQYLSETADHLKHLEVLKLYNVEFGDYREWEISNGKFPQLKILKLENLSLMKWIVADDAFPNLEQLVLHDCPDLMEIPSCFMDILSLNYIEVDMSNKFVVMSAKNIEETQVEDNQNTNFMPVIIKVHYWEKLYSV
ncbi:hypothetical protein KY289_023295 [Solanum tuberosum]|nr:hypothetical protein KY289_023295 [Solanum tuberosum]